MPRPRIVFLCTGNSCRSQMAEGWARHRLADRFDIDSAGLEAHGLNPKAVQVMQEAGVDISNQTSQTIDALGDHGADYVVTVCSHADHHCPVLPGEPIVLHQPFDDPPKLAEQAEDEEAELAVYRRVRDEIREFVESLPERLRGVSEGGDP